MDENTDTECTGHYDDLGDMQPFLDALHVKEKSYLNARPVCVAIQNAWLVHMTKFYERNVPSEFLEHTFQDFLRYAPRRLLVPTTI